MFLTFSADPNLNHKKVKRIFLYIFVVDFCDVALLILLIFRDFNCQREGKFLLVNEKSPS